MSIEDVAGQMGGARTAMQEVAATSSQKSKELAEAHEGIDELGRLLKQAAILADRLGRLTSWDVYMTYFSNDCTTAAEGYAVALEGSSQQEAFQTGVAGVRDHLQEAARLGGGSLRGIARDLEARMRKLPAAHNAFAAAATHYDEAAEGAQRILEADESYRVAIGMYPGPEAAAPSSA